MKRANMLLTVALTATMVGASAPVIANAQDSGAVLYATTADGKPLPPNPAPYYIVNAGQFGEAAPGEVSVHKPAPALPAVPTAPEPAFIQECRDPKNAGKAGTAVGWTVNHYRWCQAVDVAWDYPVGKPTHRLLAHVTTVAYADPHLRRIVAWSAIRNIRVLLGVFPDDARLSANMGCAAVAPATCGVSTQPTVGATLAEIRAQERVFRTEITNSSRGLPAPDAIANLNVYSRVTATPGSVQPPAGTVTNFDPVASRCDSAKLRTENACIFNNVWPVLSYDKADTAYPVGELIDHIRHAQDNVGAPGKFANGQAVGPPLHRQRNAVNSRANRGKAHQTCRQAKPSWNARIEQCDEYPFASTKEGANSGGPYSARLINAEQNREGGTQLSNWYAWDRILDGDQFWVQTLG